MMTKREMMAMSLLKKIHSSVDVKKIKSKEKLKVEDITSVIKLPPTTDGKLFNELVIDSYIVGYYSMKREKDTTPCFFLNLIDSETKKLNRAMEYFNFRIRNKLFEKLDFIRPHVYLDDTPANLEFLSRTQRLRDTKRCPPKNRRQSLKPSTVNAVDEWRSKIEIKALISSHEAKIRDIEDWLNTTSSIENIEKGVKMITELELKIKALKGVPKYLTFGLKEVSVS